MGEIIKKLNIILMLLLLCTSVFAASSTPQKSSDFRNYYNLSNISYITANNIQIGGINVCLENGSGCNSSFSSTYNLTYDLTAQDVTANRTLWFSTYNGSYVPYIGANNNVNLGIYNLSAGMGIFNGSVSPDLMLGYPNARLGTAFGEGRLILESGSSVWQIDNGGDNLRFFNNNTAYLRINQSGLQTNYMIYALGNITSDEFFIGDGSKLTGISTYNSSYYLNTNPWNFLNYTYNSSYDWVYNNVLTNASTWNSSYNASYVPYIGATQDVNLSGNDLLAQSVNVSFILSSIHNSGMDIRGSPWALTGAGLAADNLTTYNNTICNAMVCWTLQELNSSYNVSYVPYIGAINNVDLGIYNISAGMGVFYNNTYPDTRIGIPNARLGVDFGTGLLILENNDSVWQIDNYADNLRFFNGTDIYFLINKSGAYTDNDLYAGNDIISNGFFIGDGSQLTNIITYNNTYDLTSQDVTANRSVWNSTYNASYYLITNPNGFLNYTYNSSYDWAYNNILTNASIWNNSYNASYVPYVGATNNVDLGKHNFSLNGSIQFAERQGIQPLFYVNPIDGDGFRMEYWYNYELVNDDWLVIKKTDGNDDLPDGGIAFMMGNNTGYNYTVFELDAYGNANFTNYNITTLGNITGNYFFGNGSQLTGITHDNSSWNESYAYTLFLNRTSEPLYLTTYNSTYDLTSQDVTANRTLWFTTYNDSYYLITNPNGFVNYTYNSTYDLTSQDVTANRSAWFSTYNNSYVLKSGDNMTGSLNMGANNLTNISVMSFNVSNCDTSGLTEGTLCWNSDKHVLNMVTGLGNIVQISQETFDIVRNKAGQTIYNGQIVSMSGASGDIPEVILANASQDGSIHNLGMVTITSCVNNAECVVTSMGEVHDLNTSMFNEGDEVYLSTTNGEIVNISPSYPNYNIHLGTVLRSHATSGIIDFRREVDIDNGVVLHQLGVITNITAPMYYGGWNGSVNYNTTDELYTIFLNRTSEPLYLTTYNQTYDLTSQDVTANRSAWLSTYNASYIAGSGTNYTIPMWISNNNTLGDSPIVRTITDEDFMTIYNGTFYIDETNKVVGVNIIPGSESHAQAFQVNSFIQNGTGNVNSTGTYDVITNSTLFTFSNFLPEAVTDASNIIINGHNYYVFRYVNETEVYIRGNWSTSINNNTWNYQQAPYIDVNGLEGVERGYSISQNGSWKWAMLVPDMANNSDTLCFQNADSTYGGTTDLFCINATSKKLTSPGGMSLGDNLYIGYGASTNNTINRSTQPSGMFLPRKYIVIDSLDTEDSGYVFGHNGQPVWDLSTFVNESAKYLHVGINYRSADTSLLLAETGRIAQNKPSNVVSPDDYNHYAFNGTGLNDLNISGSYNGTFNDDFQILVVNSTHYQWRLNIDNRGWGAYSANTTFTTTPTELYKGIYVQWGAVAGHTAGNSWSFNAIALNPSGTFTIDPTVYNEVLLYNATAGTYTEVTYQASQSNSTPFNILNDTSQYVYVARYIPTLSTMFVMYRFGAGITLKEEYWNGTAWQTLAASDGVYDSTNNLANDGGVVWNALGNWQTNISVGNFSSTKGLYWMRYSTTTNATSTPQVYAITPQAFDRLRVFQAGRDTIPTFSVSANGDTRTVGTLYANTIQANQLDNLESDTLLDASHATTTTLNGVVNFTLFANDGAGEWNFNGTIYGGKKYAVPNATIALLNGTNSTPKINYIYFYVSGGIPTLATAESYPTMDHIDVATMYVGSVVGNSSYVYSYSRNRYEIDRFISKSLDRIEETGTLYVSGFSPAANTSNLNISTGTFYNVITKITTANNIRLVDGFFYINGSGNFVQASSLATFTQYSDGTAFGGGANERVNIVWGLVPANQSWGGSNSVLARLVAVLPTYQGAGNEYTSVASAITDNYDTTNFFPPNSEIKAVFVPVARTILRPSTDLFEPFVTGRYYQDIRGRTSTGGAAASSSTSNHAALDNLDYSVAGHTGFASSTQLTAVNDTITNSNASWLATYNSSYEYAYNDLIANQSAFLSTYNTSYLLGSYNLTYDLTSQDVTANRSSWFNKYNSSYDYAYNDLIANQSAFLSTYNSSYYLNTGGSINGDVIINGNLTIIGEYIEANVTTQNINGSIIPQINSQFNLGSPSKQWLAVYADNLYNTSQILGFGFKNYTYNATYDAYNSTGLIKDWNSTGYILDWNVTGYILDWNSTGLILNWSTMSSGGNTSWNESYAYTLFLNRTSEDLYTTTYNATYDAYNSTGLIKDWNSTGYILDWNSTGYILDWNITGLILNWSNIISGGDNSSWNESYAYTLFLNRTSEDLYLSTYNASYLTSSYNETYDLVSANVNANFTTWYNKFNTTYDLTSQDVAANRTSWISTYNISYLMTDGSRNTTYLNIDGNTTSENYRFEQNASTYITTNTSGCIIINGATTVMSVC